METVDNFDNEKSRQWTIRQQVLVRLYSEGKRDLKGNLLWKIMLKPVNFFFVKYEI